LAPFFSKNAAAFLFPLQAMRLIVEGRCGSSRPWKN
jgi:hypothetical protein